MSSTIVRRVEAWYKEHSESLAKYYAPLHIRSVEGDSAHGKVEIALETPLMLVSITFWNSAEVMALVVDKKLKKDAILDDRKLLFNEDIESLLDDYVRKLNNSTNAK